MRVCSRRRDGFAVVFERELCDARNAWRIWRKEKRRSRDARRIRARDRPAEKPLIAVKQSILKTKFNAIVPSDGIIEHCEKRSVEQLLRVENIDHALGKDVDYPVNCGLNECVQPSS